MKELRCNAWGVRPSTESPSPSTGEGWGEGAEFVNAGHTASSNAPLSPTPLPRWGEGLSTSPRLLFMGRINKLQLPSTVKDLTQ
jgi:hypothetical protein